MEGKERTYPTHATKLVTFSIKHWRQLHQQGHDVPRSDFDLSAYARNETRKDFTSFNRQIIAGQNSEAAKIFLVKETLSNLLGQETIKEAIALLEEHNFEILNKLKNLLYFSLNEYAGPLELGMKVSSTMKRINSSAGSSGSGSDNSTSASSEVSEKSDKVIKDEVKEPVKEKKEKSKSNSQTEEANLKS